MARMTIKKKRQQRATAMAHTTRFVAQYLDEHPRASNAQIKAAAETELDRVGFDIGTIALILELIMKIIEMFRKK